MGSPRRFLAKSNFYCGVEARLEGRTPLRTARVLRWHAASRNGDRSGWDTSATAWSVYCERENDLGT
jgi:hypothetical protein